MNFSKRDFANFSLKEREEFSLSIIAACQDQLPEVAEALGCGQYGCAFLTASGTVLKFTDQEKEGRAAEWVLSTNPQPSLPNIKQVWALEDCHPYDYQFFFIEREPLNNLRVDDYSAVENLVTDFEANFCPESAGKLPTKAQITDFFAADLPLLSSHDQKVVRAIANLYIWICRQSAWLDDVMLDNWGQRLDGTPVIRDLGAVVIF